MALQQKLKRGKIKCLNTLWTNLILFMRRRDRYKTGRHAHKYSEKENQAEPMHTI